MAKDKKAEKAAKKAQGKEPKELKKARSAWHAMEVQIDNEFRMLVREGYPMEELETLRWDYRYAKIEEFEITQEQLEFFVAESEAAAAGLPPPLAPGATWAAAAGTAPSAGGSSTPGLAQGVDYQRRSQVDLDLVEKYLERRVGRETRSEMETLYKEAFGEDLLVPAKVDLVDLSYHADISGADKAAKLSKSEILGFPEEAKPAAEAKAEAAPTAAVETAKKAKVKNPSMFVGLATAWKRGVPDYPTYDAKWWVLHPLRLWVIPARMAGKSVGKYYGIFAANIAILILQFFPGFGIPLLLRLILWGIRYIWLRFLKSKVTPAMASLREKAAVPPPTAASAPTMLPTPTMGGSASPPSMSGDTAAAQQAPPTPS